jgi:AraC-like DNA-binding protein
MRILKERITHPARSFRLQRFERDRFRAPRHRHRHFELTWIEQGVGIRFVGDSVAPFAAGDLILIGADLPHTWVSAHTGTGSSIATVMQFPIEMAQHSAFPELAQVRSWAAQAQRGLRITGGCAGEITRVLGALVAADSVAGLAGFVEILGWLGRCPGDLAPIAAAAPAGARQSGDEPRIDRVTEWVAQHMRRELRVAEGARLAGVSPAAFSRFFRREVGKPFSTYVNDVRCAEACLKLRQLRMPIALIAEQCGFRSLSHFNRQFRRRIGRTPRQYRRQA